MQARRIEGLRERKTSKTSSRLTRSSMEIPAAALARRFQILLISTPEGRNCPLHRIPRRAAGRDKVPREQRFSLTKGLSVLRRRGPGNQGTNFPTTVDAEARRIEARGCLFLRRGRRAAA